MLARLARQAVRCGRVKVPSFDLRKRSTLLRIAKAADGMKFQCLLPIVPLLLLRQPMWFSRVIAVLCQYAVRPCAALMHVSAVVAKSASASALCFDSTVSREMRCHDLSISPPATARTPAQCLSSRSAHSPFTHSLRLAHRLSPCSTTPDVLIPACIQTWSLRPRAQRQDALRA